MASSVTKFAPTATYSNGRGERSRGCAFELIFTIVPAVVGTEAEVAG